MVSELGEVSSLSARKELAREIQFVTRPTARHALSNRASVSPALPLASNKLLGGFLSPASKCILFGGLLPAWLSVVLEGSSIKRNSQD